MVGDERNHTQYVRPGGAINRLAHTTAIRCTVFEGEGPKIQAQSRENKRVKSGGQDESMGSDGIERAASSRTLPVGDNAAPENPFEGCFWKSKRTVVGKFNVALFSHANSTKHGKHNSEYKRKSSLRTRAEAPQIGVPGTSSKEHSSTCYSSVLGRPRAPRYVT